MEKIAWDGPKWGREGLFSADPDLADILGRPDLDFENLYFVDFLDSKFMDVQVAALPGSQISKIWPETIILIIKNTHNTTDCADRISGPVLLLVVLAHI